MAFNLELTKLNTLHLVWPRPKQKPLSFTPNKTLKINMKVPKDVSDFNPGFPKLDKKENNLQKPNKIKEFNSN